MFTFAVGLVLDFALQIIHIAGLNNWLNNAILYFVFNQIVCGRVLILYNNKKIHFNSWPKNADLNSWMYLN